MCFLAYSFIRSLVDVFATVDDVAYKLFALH